MAQMRLGILLLVIAGKAIGVSQSEGICAA